MSEFDYVKPSLSRLVPADEGLGHPERLGHLDLRQPCLAPELA